MALLSLARSLALRVEVASLDGAEGCLDGVFVRAGDPPLLHQLVHQLCGAARRGAARRGAARGGVCRMRWRGAVRDVWPFMSCVHGGVVAEQRGTWSWRAPEWWGLACKGKRGARAP